MAQRLQDARFLALVLALPLMLVLVLALVLMMPLGRQRFPRCRA